MKLPLFMILAALAVASVSAQDINYPTRRLKKGGSSATSSKSEKKPRSSSSSKSEKKPRSSSSSKSRKTPRSYTSSKSRKNPSSRCVPNDRPRPVRSGQRFRFNLVQSNARCVDRDRELYEYGQFNNVKDFSACADVCVKGVQSSLINSGSFRGIDFDCRRSQCRCLYDEGTLSNRNSARFDRTRRNQNGYGSIDGTRNSRDIYCGKLAGAEALGADEYLEADVMELWDN